MGLEVSSAINVREFDVAIRRSERVVLSTYGDSVSVAAKGKTLRKFGRNRTVGNAWETVAEFQGTTANETFVSTNLVDSIVSSSTSDTTQTITIEGHTIDGSGNLTFTVQTKALTGQTEATLATPLARVTRAYVAASGVFNTTPATLVGNVYIYDNTGGMASGTPTDPTATKCVIMAGETQSNKGSTSISLIDYWFITSFTCAFGDTAASVDYATVRMETRDVFNGGAWRPTGKDYTIWPNEIGVFTMLEPPVIVPKNHDWRVIAKTDANTAEIYAEAGGYLALIQ